MDSITDREDNGTMPSIHLIRQYICPRLQAGKGELNSKIITLGCTITKVQTIPLILK